MVQRSLNGTTYTSLPPLAANSTTYTDNSLLNNTAYYYRVYAVNATGNSGYSNVLNVTTLLPLPAAPTGLTAGTITATSVQLTWTDNASNETSYVVQRSLNGTTYTSLPPLAANSTTYTDNSLLNNTAYYYRVYAVNATGNSAYSNVLNVTTLLPLPAAPTGLTAGTITATSVQLTWTDNASNETSYVVQRSLNGTTYTSLPPLAANSTTYTDNSLLNNTAYYYRVYAVNATGNSGYSNVLNVTTLLPLPAAPTGLTAGTITATSVQLTWTDNASNETSYVVQRSLNGTTYTSLPPLAANSTTYTDNSLLNNTAYYYRVYAVNATGNSGYSNVVNVTTLLPLPAAPTGLTAGTITATSVQLTWTDNASNETSYVVQRSLNGTTYTSLPPLAANSTTYTDNSLLNNTAYYYRVYAVNATGNSGYSNVVNVTTLLPLPAAPTGLSAGNITATSVRLTWTDNASNETSYVVQRSLNGTTYTSLPPLAANSTTYTDNSLLNNTAYYYRVYAVNATGNSAYSNVVNVTTLLPLPLHPVI